MTHEANNSSLFDAEDFKKIDQCLEHYRKYQNNESDTDGNDIYEEDINLYWEQVLIFRFG